MSDNEEQEEQEGVKPEEKNTDPLSALSADARKIFEDTQAGLLSALQKERDANGKAAERLATVEKENQERLEKQLEEQGKYKELAEERARALAEMKIKADGAESAQATLKEVLEAQIESIPEAKRSLVPVELPTEKQLAWIARNRSLLSKAQPFDIGAGETGGSGDENVEITDEQKRAAKRVGMSPEDFIKYS